MMNDLRQYLMDYYGATKITFHEMYFTKHMSSQVKEDVPYKLAAREIPMYADKSTEQIKKMKSDAASRGKYPHPHHTLVSLGQNIARLNRLGCEYMALREEPDNRRRNCYDPEKEEPQLFQYHIDVDKNQIKVLSIDGLKLNQTKNMNIMNRVNTTVMWKYDYNRYTCKKGCSWRGIHKLGKMHVAFIAKRVVDRLLDGQSKAIKESTWNKNRPNNRTRSRSSNRTSNRRTNSRGESITLPDLDVNNPDELLAFLNQMPGTQPPLSNGEVQAIINGQLRPGNGNSSNQVSESNIRRLAQYFYDHPINLPGSGKIVNQPINQRMFSNSGTNSIPTPSQIKNIEKILRATSNQRSRRTNNQPGPQSRKNNKSRNNNSNNGANSTKKDNKKASETTKPKKRTNSIIKKQERKISQKEKLQAIMNQYDKSRDNVKKTTANLETEINQYLPKFKLKGSYARPFIFETYTPTALAKDIRKKKKETREYITRVTKKKNEAVNKKKTLSNTNKARIENIIKRWGAAQMAPFNTLNDSKLVKNYIRQSKKKKSKQ
jgi:hypothetical protein